MQAGKKHGMQTVNDALQVLDVQGTIPPRETTVMVKSTPPPDDAPHRWAIIRLRAKIDASEMSVAEFAQTRGFPRAPNTVYRWLRGEHPIPKDVRIWLLGNFRLLHEAQPATERDADDPEGVRMTDTIFGQIVRGEAPADIVYQDELVTAFRDVDPQAPTHILIVPNQAVPTLADVTNEHEPALGRMIRVASSLAEEEGIDEDGYRLVMNCRAHGGQDVYHVHLHLIGGRPLGRMLPD